MYYEENYQWNIDITTMDAVSVFYMTSDGLGFPSHSHSFYEIRYNRNGQHEITLNDQHIFLPKGSLTFISPLTIHSFCKELLPADLLHPVPSENTRCIASCRNDPCYLAFR